MVLQSSWLSGRLSTVFGLRHDKATYHDWGTYRAVPGEGRYERDPDNFAVTPYPGKTYTVAAVAHLTEHISLLFNASSSIGDPKYKVSYLPDARVMEPQQGAGRDIGLKFSIPKTRLSGMLTYYRASATNEPSTGGTGNQEAQWLGTRNNAMLTALVDANIFSESEVRSLHAKGTGDTTDSKTHGFEAAIAGDIKRNWSLRASYTYTKRTREDAWPRIRAWRDDVLLPFWATLERENPNLPGSGRNILDSVQVSGGTLRESADLMLSSIRVNTENSLQVRGTRPHKFRLFSTYLFDSGWLKGARIGGGIRYDSANIAGQDENGMNYYGFDNTNFDFIAQYNRKMLGVDWRFQINVYNAFRSKPKAAPSLINPAGTWDSIIVQPPREISLTVQVKF
jgi:outer membrane receptor protein involved in Fe transport